MGVAYNLNKYFEINKNLEAILENDVVVIDNFYKNPDRIYEWLTKQDYPLFGITDEETRNGKDYTDSKLIFGHMGTDPWSIERNNFLLSVVKTVYKAKEAYWTNSYDFNVFRALKNFTKETQHIPHVDGDSLNVLVYLDKKQNGGTAFYKGEQPKKEKVKNLIVDVSNYEIYKLIPAKFNRCVIFKGDIIHGAYINDYSKYLHDYRFTQIMFLEIKE